MRLILKVVLLGACAIAVTSCSEDGGDPGPGSGASGTQEVTADPTSTESPTAPTESRTTPPDADPTGSDTADLEALNARYWDVFTDLQNNPRVEPGVYDGVATRGVVEEDLAYIRTELIENGLHREGGPEVGNVTITVDGDTATLEMCIDETDWIVIKDGEEVEFDLGVTATGMRADRSSGRWLISDVALPKGELNVTC